MLGPKSDVSPHWAAVAQVQDRRPSKGPKKVTQACIACKEAHAACDSGTPCKRCVKRGITCIPAPQRKRGRKPGRQNSNRKPRKRDRTSRPSALAEAPAPTPKFEEILDKVDFLRESMELLDFNFEIDQLEHRRDAYMSSGSPLNSREGAAVIGSSAALIPLPTISPIPNPFAPTPSMTERVVASRGSAGSGARSWDATDQAVATIIDVTAPFRPTPSLGLSHVPMRPLDSPVMYYTTASSHSPASTASPFFATRPTASRAWPHRLPHEIIPSPGSPSMGAAGGARVGVSPAAYSGSPTPSPSFVAFPAPTVQSSRGPTAVLTRDQPALFPDRYMFMATTRVFSGLLGYELGALENADWDRVLPAVQRHEIIDFLTTNARRDSESPYDITTARRLVFMKRTGSCISAHATLQVHYEKGDHVEHISLRIRMDDIWENVDVPPSDAPAGRRMSASNERMYLDPLKTQGSWDDELAKELTMANSGGGRKAAALMAATVPSSLPSGPQREGTDEFLVAIKGPIADGLESGDFSPPSSPPDSFFGSTPADSIFTRVIDPVKRQDSLAAIQIGDAGPLTTSAGQLITVDMAAAVPAAMADSEGAAFQRLLARRTSERDSILLRSHSGRDESLFLNSDPYSQL